MLKYLEAVKNCTGNCKDCENNKIDCFSCPVCNKFNNKCDECHEYFREDY